MDKPRFHLTSLAAPNIVDEIVRTFRITLDKLGYETNYQAATVQDGWVNVICFAISLTPESVDGLRARKDCIVVNFEQLVEGSTAFTPHYLQLLRDHFVWEYSDSNLRRYAALGIPSGVLVPLGFEDEADLNVRLHDRLPDSERDIDVVFFGGHSPRRAAVLDAMRSRGLRVAHSDGVSIWDIEHRDALLRRAKVALNMHRYENSRIVEVPRLHILLRQRKAVLCELYADSEIPAELRSAVVGATFETLADAAVALVANAALRDELERKGLQALRVRPHGPNVERGIAAFVQWRTMISGMGTPSVSVQG